MTDSEADGARVVARRRLLGLAPHGILVVAALVAARDLWFHLSDRMVGLVWGRGMLEGTVWWYWNVTHAPFLGHNPLHNTLQGYPVGINYIELKGNLGDALLSAPFFWAFDLPASYNLTMVAFLIFNGVAAQLFFHRWLRHRWLALCFALSVTFHPFLLYYLEDGKPTQFVMGWVFLGLLAFDRLMEGPREGRIRLLVVAMVGSFLCFWFYGAFLAILLATMLGVIALRLDAGERRVLSRKLALAGGLTVLFCLPFGLPFLFELFVGDGIEGVELMSGLSPQVWPEASASLEDPFLLRPRYQLFLPYVAVALLLGTLVRGIALRGSSPLRTTTWAALAGTGVFYVLLLGPYLCVNGEPLTLGGRLVMLPWAVLHKGVPFFSRLSYPYYAFPFLLIAALMFGGRWLARGIQPGRPRAVRFASGAVAVLLVLEIALRAPPVVVTSPFEVPEFYGSIEGEEGVEAIIEFPFGMDNFHQMYQPFHGKSLLGAEGSEDSFLEWAGMQELFDRTPMFRELYAWQMRGIPPSGIDAGEIRDVAGRGYGYLVVDRHGVNKSVRLRHFGFEACVRELSAVFGPPAYRSDGLAAFRLKE